MSILNKVFVFLCLVSFSSDACYFLTEITSMKTTGNNNVAIEFNTGSEHVGNGPREGAYKLVDDDGFATLYILYYSTTVNLARDLFIPDNDISWEKVKTVNVKEWPAIKRTMLNQLERLSESYKKYEIMAKERNLSRYERAFREGAAKIERALSEFNKDNITYEEYNKLGEMLKDFQKLTSYKVNGQALSFADPDMKNPIGTFARRPIILPPRTYPRCFGDYKADSEALAKSLESTGQSNEASSNINSGSAQSE